jgi:putative transposase
MLCFEDLNIEGMKRIWGRKVSDLGFSEFMAILEAKASVLGKIIIKINRFDPSSQVCSECGHRQSMPLSERVFACRNCGVIMDRDHTAARNSKSWGINSGLGNVRRSTTAIPD